MHILAIVSSLSSLLPLIAAVFSIKYLTKDLKIFFLMFIAASIVDISTLYLGLIKSERNVLLFHIYTLIEFILLIYLFIRWQTNPLIKKAMALNLPIFVIVWILSKSYIESWNRIDYFTTSIESVFLIGASTITLYQLNSENKILSFKDYRFLISTGVLIYFGSNLFIFGMSNLIDVWSVHSAINILCNILYAITFLCQHPRLRFSGFS